jgi:hypothetical protein
MSKLTRLFGTCLFIASISATAFADGGVTQGPPAPPPSGQSFAYSTEVDDPNQPAQDSSVDIGTALDTLTNWLTLAIL